VVLAQVQLVSVFFATPQEELEQTSFVSQLFKPDGPPEHFLSSGHFSTSTPGQPARTAPNASTIANIPKTIFLFAICFLLYLWLHKLSLCVEIPFFKAA
jgi:hypothetical protein